MTAPDPEVWWCETPLTSSPLSPLELELLAVEEAAHAQEALRMAQRLSDNIRVLTRRKPMTGELRAALAYSEHLAERLREELARREADQ